MRISTAILFLAFVNFLHFKRADGVVPDDPSNFPPNHIVLTMHDGCTADGRIRETFDTPWWLQHNAAHPDLLLYYIRMPYEFFGTNHQFENHFNGIHRIFAHDPARHTPRNVQIHIDIMDEAEYYSADSFQVFNVSQQTDFFLPANCIYVAVPHDKVYKAVLRYEPYKKNVDRQPYLFPKASKKGPWFSRVF